jgi:dTDP-D-glucose 4,6-dehydratase
VLICSTDHVFGDVAEEDIPVKETHSVNYAGPYDTSKANAELVTRCYQKTYPQEMPKTCITRCANVFGYGDTAPRRIIPEFIQKALQSKRIDYRTSMNGRQFVHVADALTGYILAISCLDHPSIVKEATHRVPTFHFSLADYRRMSPLEGAADDETRDFFIRVRDLAKLIASLTGAEAMHQELAGNALDEVLAKMPEGDTKERVRCTRKIEYAPNENPVLGLSCENAKRFLGWSPNKDFRKCLQDLVGWYELPPTFDADHRRKALLEDAINKCVRSLVARSVE